MGFVKRYAPTTIRHVILSLIFLPVTLSSLAFVYASESLKLGSSLVLFISEHHVASEQYVADKFREPVYMVS